MAVVIIANAILVCQLYPWTLD